MIGRVRCPLIDMNYISLSDCIENIDIAEGLIKEENMPNRFKEKDDWRKICLECERHD